MAAHQHIWQTITLGDGSVARVCLCGSFRVQFATELPRPHDVFAPETLDELEQEGTADVASD